MQTVSPKQLFKLIEAIREFHGLSNNPNEIKEVLYQQYGIHADIDLITEWLEPSISELIDDAKIIAKTIGYEIDA